MKWWKWLLIVLALVAGAIWLNNASWLAPEPKGERVVIAHRGVAQQFSREGVDNQTCTATRIRPPEHTYIENTIPSMERALALGADGIELDVHPTSDGAMVVFHDWTLDCRTNGTGPTRRRTLAELKALDVGYGYTADGGKTFPLRGTGVGAMPTVEEVLRRFPATPFAFNFKSRDPRDADLLVAAFHRAGLPVGGQHFFYGDPRVTRRLKKHVPEALTYGKQQIRACLFDYLKLGWTGYVPDSCRNTAVAIPLNYQWVIWGWPNRFQDRMAGAGSRVLLLGDYEDGNIAGIERPEQLERVPESFRGSLWVEDIHRVGPALRR